MPFFTGMAGEKGQKKTKFPAPGPDALAQALVWGDEMGIFPS